MSRSTRYSTEGWGVLETAVKGQRWDVVSSLLRGSNYSSGIVEQFVTACEQYDVIHVDGEILSHCSSEQIDHLLKTAVKLCRWSRDGWNDVKALLQDSNYSSSSVEQFVTACEQYDVIHVDGEILSHCRSEQKDRLLKIAVRKQGWQEVDILLHDSNYSSSSVEQFVAACELNEVIHVDCEILSHCSSDQKDRLLKRALTPSKMEWIRELRKINERWNAVKILLQAYNYSSSSVEQFVTACEQYKVIHVDREILSHCSSQQKDRLLKTALFACIWNDYQWSAPGKMEWIRELMENNKWNAVRILLQDCNYSSSSVEQIVAACEQYDEIHVDGEILSHFSSEQKDRLLKIALKPCRGKGRWSEVKDLLQDCNYSSSSVEIFIAACEQYSVIHVDHEILSHCSSQQMDRLLKTAVELSRRSGDRWTDVKILLHDSNYSCSSVEQFVTACEQYDVIHFDGEILSHCSSDQKDRLLKTASKPCRMEWVWGWENKERWKGVKILLQVSNYSSSSVEQFVTACEQYDVIHVDREILSHCSSDQKDRLLKTALQLCRGVQYHHTEKNWNDVKILLQDSNYRSSSVEQFVAACEQYEAIHVDREILSHCTSEQTDCLLKTAVKLFTCRWFQNWKIWRPWSDVKMLLQHSNYSSVQQFVTVSEHNIKIHVDHEILSHCTTQQLDRLLTLATTLKQWNVVGRLLKYGYSHEQRVWVIEQTCQIPYNCQSILPHVNYDFLSQCNTQQLDCFLTAFTEKRQWQIVDKVLKVGGSHEKRVWVIEQACGTTDYKGFEDYILPHVDGDFLSQCSTDQLLKTLLSPGFQDKMSERGVSAKSRMWAMSEACKGLTYATVTRIMNIVFRISNVQLLINSLSSNQLSREAQNMALRFALQKRKWGVISRANLSQVWEQVRRHLFREAVYQEQWTVVKKWADHTLYDDERWWALEEAYKHKQWDVMLQLADYGLTEIELMRVRYRLAKHADWDVVLQMIRRGVDVTEVREVLESTVISRKTKTTTDRATQQALALRWRQLRQLEETLTRASARCLKLPSTALQWRTVLFHLHRHPGTACVSSRSHPGKTFGELLLQRAIEQRAWQLVMHLVRLGMDTDQLDSLLTDMMRRRQWGVCRVLLEQGVSVQSCLSALSVFLEMNQWTLVAKVMEFIVDEALERQVEQCALDRSVRSLVWQCVNAMCRYGMCVGDAVKLQVMQRAKERREGSVVGECISTLQHYRLSVKEREELFQQAISLGFLQAVKPLVEEKEETEFQYRDATMLAAIEQRQWDVVDCCQLQGAHIDMKDVHGETPLNREVRKDYHYGDFDSEIEWKAVEELLERGANPNVLDKDGWSVLNRAIKAKQWDIVRLLIECLGDIHKPARSNNDWYDTPLQLLIDERQGEIIEHTLIWCPDQAKGVNDQGETTLHAIALDKKPELMYYQIVRGVNPLTLTKEGHSVLFYAVENEHCPQRMVGECIRLGFSTHQPTLTRQPVGMVKFATYGLLNEWKMFGGDGLSEWYNGITSPFLLAVLRGMPVVAHMLYESGSCSYPELLHVYTILLDLSDPHSEDGRKLLEGIYIDARARCDRFRLYRQRYDAFMNTLTTFLPYLREMASTPRSLVSTCRMVISHCLTVRRRHERDLQDLDLTDRMKDYLLFSDLTDPDYQWFLYGTLPLLPPQTYVKELKQRRGRKGLNTRPRR